MATKDGKRRGRVQHRGPVPNMPRRRARSKRKLKPITLEPAKCQFHPDGFSLNTLAYIMGIAIGCPLTTAQVSGAIRRLKLANDDTRYQVTMRGPVGRRQQTWVHKSKLKVLEQDLRERWNP